MVIQIDALRAVGSKDFRQFLPHLATLSEKDFAEKAAPKHVAMLVAARLCNDSFIHVRGEMEMKARMLLRDPSALDGNQDFSDVFFKCLEHEWKDVMAKIPQQEDTLSKEDKAALVCNAYADLAVNFNESLKAYYVDVIKEAKTQVDAAVMQKKKGEALPLWQYNFALSNSIYIAVYNKYGFDALHTLIGNASKREVSETPDRAEWHRLTAGTEISNEDFATLVLQAKRSLEGKAKTPVARAKEFVAVSSDYQGNLTRRDMIRRAAGALSLAAIAATDGEVPVISHVTHHTSNVFSEEVREKLLFGTACTGITLAAAALVADHFIAEMDSRINEASRCLYNSAISRHAPVKAHQRVAEDIISGEKSR